MTTSEALTHITALLDALETCHICCGTLALDDVGPTHCENCSSDCDEHEAPACAPLSQLHSEARRAVRLLQKAGAA